MNFISTRNKNQKVTASQAILKGLSYEGGLFVPDEFPQITLDDLSRIAKMPYEERAFSILELFLNDFSREEIEHCVHKAYTVKGKFEDDICAPLRKINDREFFLELWHGPTCAFKDMALQILPYLLTVSAKKANIDKEVVILTATSGDTGKAALEGFKDVEGTRVAVFYPKDGVSPVQKMQMITQEGKNVFVSGIEGNFDDAQNAVKAIFTDDAYNQEINQKGYLLSSANSINWGRLVPQIVYYVSAYCDLLLKGEIKNGEAINFVVPTGNFGNILAAYYAKKMGLPISRLICASNKNKVLTDFINTGIYDKNREFMLSISPSMDILISSNLERLLFDLSGCNDETVNSFMADLKETGKYEINEPMKKVLSELFYAEFADDAQTKKAIRDTYEKNGYLIDTHTGVAKSVYDLYVEETGDTTKTVIVSTASPFKFNKSVTDAIFGEEIANSCDEFALLDLLAQKTGLKIPNSLDRLNEKEIRFGHSVAKSKIKDAVSGFLNL